MGLRDRFLKYGSSAGNFNELLTQFLKYGDEPVTVGDTLYDNSNKVYENSQNRKTISSSFQSFKQKNT